MREGDRVEYESYMFDKVSKYRKEVISVLKRNGIEGKILNAVQNCMYDYKIENMMRCNRNVKPVDFVKQLICDVIW